MNRLKRWLYRATGRPTPLERVGRAAAEGSAQGLSGSRALAAVAAGTYVPEPVGACRTTGCSGDPFIADPCPVEDCQLGCDEYAEAMYRCTAACDPVACVVDEKDLLTSYGCQMGCDAC